MQDDVLKKFVTTNESNFTLDDIPAEEKQDLLNYCLQQIEINKCPISVDCLRCVRILTRDDQLVAKLTIDSLLTQFVARAFSSTQSQPNFQDVQAESLKCLLNLTIKRRSIVAFLRSLGLVDQLLIRLNEHILTNSWGDVLLFDLKLLFLLSGVDLAVRKELCQHKDFFRQLHSLLEAAKSNTLSSRDCEVICEILKTAYNIGYGIQRDATLLKERISEFDAYCDILRGYLVKLNFSMLDQLNIVRHIVNFLNVLPKRSFAGLLFPMECLSEPGSKNTEMSAVQVLIDFLDMQLPQADENKSDSTTYVTGSALKESLCPIVNSLVRASQGNRSISKYCRAQILPHLGAEVVRLPEQGTTLRNRLCKLLTHPVHDVSELIALFLFILCKEDIGRAIKYTGFGNFAGFLARHALLGSAGNKRKRSATVREPEQQSSLETSIQDSAEEYSSTSTDSDTDEYEHLKDMVNPVTGRWETPKPDPLEGMPESQKEFLVMELVRDIDRLQRGGIIQPGKFGEDGTVQPTSHVLELLKGSHTPEQEDSD